MISIIIATFGSLFKSDNSDLSNSNSNNKLLLLLFIIAQLTCYQNGMFIFCACNKKNVDSII